MKFKVEIPNNSGKKKAPKIYREITMEAFLQAKLSEPQKKYFETEKSYTRRLLRALLGEYPRAWRLVPDDEHIVQRANPMY